MGVACAPAMLVLAAIAVGLHGLVVWGLDSMVPVRPEDSGIGYSWAPLAWHDLGPLQWLLRHAWEGLFQTMAPWPMCLLNLESRSPGLWLRAVFELLFWTLFGVALCRAAATPWCRESAPEFRASAKWSLNRWVTGWTSLLTPLGGILLLRIVIGLLLLPGAIPGLGSAWLWVIGPIVAGCSLMVGFLVCLAPWLWLLMVAAVAVDDADAFSAFSRGFSYLTSHPWQAAGWFLLQLVVASVCLLAGQAVIQGAWSVIEHYATHYPEGLANVMERALRPWIAGVYATFATSLGFSQVTLVYLALREATDGTPFSTLAGGDEDARFHDEFPVVGMPAMRAATPPADSVP
jgi:hypothetical protein